MFKNHFKTAWRNLVKGKMHSFINIIGLSIGMAVTILIGLWIWSELSFNKNFDNYDRIAQVMQTETLNGNVVTGKGNVIPLAKTLRNNYAGDFKHVVLSSWSMNSLVNAGDKSINTQGNYMETEAPGLLSLKMIAGTAKSFQSKSTVLLSASMAKVLFGNVDAIGKVVKIDGDLDEKVVGVYQDFPENSSFKDVSFIAPFYDLTSWVTGNEDSWTDESFQIFVQLNPNADFKTVSNKIRHIKLDKIDAQTARSEHPQMLLQPMSKWHLYSEFKNGVNVGGAIQYVWMFAIIGVFVLLLACINFMNLSTARSEKRAKEVGIRKAIGSLRSQLINQFFSESLLTAMLAFIFSLALVVIVLPFFNSVSGKHISLPLNNVYFWLIGVGFSIITGLIAGVYPALYLSSFRPVKVLKGTFKAGRNASTPRKVLVILQFTVSVVLIIATITIFRQVQFAKSRPTGYNNQGLITIIMRTDNYHNNLNNMRNDLLEQGAIADMAESNSPVTENDHFSNGFSWAGMNATVSARFNTVNVTQDYGKTVGLQFIDGRDFDKPFSQDSTSIILNQKAADYIGFKNPIGKTIQQYGTTYTIIGVVKDAVTESPYEPAKPTIYFPLGPLDGGILNIKLNPNMAT
ncbi:MAG TPA: ABC transporter permease, partial [Parafilimonas sp.]|nr:ABC transporter permease [Parafilimonas sp.]